MAKPEVDEEPRVVSGGLRQRGIFAAGTSGQPLVTVITAIFNGREHLAGCIESVLGQEYPNLEHILVDGGSRDGTLEILLEYDDRVALWKSEPDKGIYDAWNKAMKEARGEWICFVGVDDELLPDAVRRYMELAARHPDAEYLSSRVRVIHRSGYLKVLGEAWNWSRFSRMMCTPHIGAMHHRSLFERLGEYDTSYRIVADYELLLRARDTLRTAYMPDVTALMRAGGVGSSWSSRRETARAKSLTGGRSRLLTELDLVWEYILFPLRPPVRWVLRKFSRGKTSACRG